MEERRKDDRMKSLLKESKRKTLLYEKILDISADGFLIVNSQVYVFKWFWTKQV